MKKAMFIEHGYAHLAYHGGDQIVTTCLRTGRYVRIDDGRQYPQLCAEGHRTGNTLTYDGDEQLAKDCGAYLYKTRKGYDRAAAKLAAMDWYDE